MDCICVLKHGSGIFLSQFMQTVADPAEIQLASVLKVSRVINDSCDFRNRHPESPAELGSLGNPCHGSQNQLSVLSYLSPFFCLLHPFTNKQPPFFASYNCHSYDCP